MVCSGTRHGASRRCARGPRADVRAGRGAGRWTLGRPWLRWALRSPNWGPGTRVQGDRHSDGRPRARTERPGSSERSRGGKIDAADESESARRASADLAAPREEAGAPSPRRTRRQIQQLAAKREPSRRSEGGSHDWKQSSRSPAPASSGRRSWPAQARHPRSIWTGSSGRPSRRSAGSSRRLRRRGPRDHGDRTTAQRAAGRHRPIEHVAGSDGPTGQGSEGLLMDLRARTSEVDQRMRAALEPMTTIGSLHG